MIDQDLKNEPHCAVHFYHWFVKSASETIATMKEAYKDCLGGSTIFQRHKAFQESQESTELFLSSGKPVTPSNKININTITVLVQESHYITVAEISILKDKLQLTHICTR